MPAGWPWAAVQAVLDMQTPEIAYVYSGVEFNDEFGPTAALRIARARADARIARKAIRRKRYQRMHDRHRRYPHPTKYTIVSEEVWDENTGQCVSRT